MEPPGLGGQQTPSAIAPPSQSSTKVAIQSNLFSDFYALIGTGSLETGWFTTIMKLPFIFCIWLGFTAGAAGGLISLKKQLQKYKLYWI
jgi:cytochrome c biogenesis factor